MSILSINYHTKCTDHERDPKSNGFGDMNDFLVNFGQAVASIGYLNWARWWWWLNQYYTRDLLNFTGQYVRVQADILLSIGRHARLLTQMPRLRPRVPQSLPKCARTLVRTSNFTPFSMGITPFFRNPWSFTQKIHPFLEIHGPWRGLKRLPFSMDL